MRTLYLVCYDISCAKRLYQVRKYLSGFRVGGQKSFFECWLTATELHDVLNKLMTLLDLNADRAHVFQLDPRNQRDLLGVATAPQTKAVLII